MPNLTEFELVMFMSCDGHNLEGCKLVQEQDILETPCGVYICMSPSNSDISWVRVSLLLPLVAQHCK